MKMPPNDTYALGPLFTGQAPIAQSVAPET